MRVGESRPLYIQLLRPPLADVVIRISASPCGVAVISPSALLFSLQSWRTPQKVFVTALGATPLVDGAATFLSPRLGDSAATESNTAVQHLFPPASLVILQLKPQSKDPSYSSPQTVAWRAPLSLNGTVPVAIVNALGNAGGVRYSQSSEEGIVRPWLLRALPSSTVSREGGWSSWIISSLFPPPLLSNTATRLYLNSTETLRVTTSSTASSTNQTVVFDFDLLISSNEANTLTTTTTTTNQSTLLSSSCEHHMHGGGALQTRQQLLLFSETSPHIIRTSSAGFVIHGLTTGYGVSAEDANFTVVASSADDYSADGSSGTAVALKGPFPSRYTRVQQYHLTSNHSAVLWEGGRSTLTVHATVWEKLNAIALNQSLFHLPRHSPYNASTLSNVSFSARLLSRPTANAAVTLTVTCPADSGIGNSSASLTYSNSSSDGEAVAVVVDLALNHSLLNAFTLQSSRMQYRVKCQLSAESEDYLYTSPTLGFLPTPYLSITVGESTANHQTDKQTEYIIYD